ncbi:single-stranded DNA-binding protein [Streptomyces sp. NPDC056441]|uniref:single-stranded DNA-binding protein n=1 Tax=Streptomyces sp. NPDC056441 TaxID=3345817 RepID=UPI0036A6195C
MSGETAAVVRGRVYGTVQLRHTERGTPAARFTVVQVPREYDRTHSQWRDGEPVPVICTVTGPLARHVAECLTDAVHVIVTGHLTIRDNLLYLDSAQVGVDLAHHVAYIDDTLPAVLAGPARPTTAARPAPAAASDADWWWSAPRSSWDAVTAPSRTGR